MAINGKMILASFKWIHKCVCAFDNSVLYQSVLKNALLELPTVEQAIPLDHRYGNYILLSEVCI